MQICGLLSLYIAYTTKYSLQTKRLGCVTITEYKIKFVKINICIIRCAFKETEETKLYLIY